jgi:hypothetical protein
MGRKVPASLVRPLAMPLSVCQARALAREVGALREELQRETRRRERAVACSAEREALLEAAEARVKQLQYANRCMRVWCMGRSGQTGTPAKRSLAITEMRNLSMGAK